MKHLENNFYVSILLNDKSHSSKSCTITHSISTLTHSTVINCVMRLWYFHFTHSFQILIHHPHKRENEISILNINQEITALCAGRLNANDEKDILAIGTRNSILVHHIDNNSDLFYAEVTTCMYSIIEFFMNIAALSNQIKLKHVCSYIHIAYIKHCWKTPPAFLKLVSKISHHNLLIIGYRYQMVLCR